MTDLGFREDFLEFSHHVLTVQALGGHADRPVQHAFADDTWVGGWVGGWVDKDLLLVGGWVGG